MAHARPRGGGPFRGWWIVGVAFAGQAFAIAPLLVYTISVFLKPLADAFHASRAAIALAVSLLDIAVACTAWGAGWLVDRYNARVVIGSSIATLAICMVAMAFVQPPLWHLYALYAVAGCVGVASSPVTYGRVMANWFDRRRGLALGISNAGGGLGTFITLPFAQFLTDRVGWRGAYLGLAGVTLVTALPLVGLFLHGKPQDLRLEPDGVPPTRPRPAIADSPTGMEFGAAIRTGTFWQMCLIFFVVGGCVTGTYAHLVPLLTDRGVSGQVAALVGAVFGLAGIVGRIGNGYLVDRFFAPRVAALMFAGAGGGIALLLIGATGVAPAIAAALLGLAIGAEGDVIPFLISRYFGLRSMARLLGCAFAAYTLGNATGRWLLALGFDVTKSYRLSLEGAGAGMAVAVVATLLLKEYRPTTTPSPQFINKRTG